MRYSFLACVGIISVVLGLGGSAWALPVTVDGNIDGADNYFATIDDDNAEAAFESTSWDIDMVRFDTDSNWFYIGLDTVGRFDPDGSESSFLDKTVFFGFVISDVVNRYAFNLTSTVAGFTLTIDGVTLTQGTDYVAANDNDLELKIARDRVAGIGEDFFFAAQLDNTGFGIDDQVSGEVTGVPEPGTMALLAIGGLLALSRRRRA